MWNDPIVDEIHAIRQQLLHEAGGDIHELIRRAIEQHDPKRITIQGQPRKPALHNGARQVDAAQITF